MEIKVGDYVRTKEGYICKILEIHEEYDDEYLDWNDINSASIRKSHIVKSSLNIIDLIEVGDYVNGREVREVYDLGFGKCFCFKNEYGRHYDKTYKIKSIITKEQFESMEYKVND